jgi:hypothetical protein
LKIKSLPKILVEVQVPKTFSSDIPKIILEISSGTTYYYNSMKKVDFVKGEKMALSALIVFSFVSISDVHHGHRP